MQFHKKTKEWPTIEIKYISLSLKNWSYKSVTILPRSNLERRNERTARTFFCFKKTNSIIEFNVHKTKMKIIWTYIIYYTETIIIIDHQQLKVSSRSMWMVIIFIINVRQLMKSVLTWKHLPLTGNVLYVFNFILFLFLYSIEKNILLQLRLCN